MAISSVLTNSFKTELLKGVSDAKNLDSFDVTNRLRKHLTGIVDNFKSLPDDVKAIGEKAVEVLKIAPGLPAEAKSLGMKAPKALKAIKKTSQINGRLENIRIPKKMKKKISIFIDYAHTPDALKKSLETLKKKSSKLSVVFGCGGDRDKKKRPLMGKIANSLADKVYITDDNPRGESAKEIRKEIISNCPKAIEIKNRYSAIMRAINNCEEGENLLIAGKGHENYQIIGEKIYKFSDKDTVLKILKKI